MKARGTAETRKCGASAAVRRIRSLTVTALVKTTSFSWSSWRMNRSWRMASSPTPSGMAISRKSSRSSSGIGIHSSPASSAAPGKSWASGQGGRSRPSPAGRSRLGGRSFGKLALARRNEPVPEDAVHGAERVPDPDLLALFHRARNVRDGQLDQPQRVSPAAVREQRGDLRLEPEPLFLEGQLLDHVRAHDLVAGL